MKTYDPFERLEKEKKHFEKTMTTPEAKSILGNSAEWELKNMKKALELIPFLNTTEENLRLAAVKHMLKIKKNKNKKL